MNNLNCHVEPKRQLRAETSQPLHISPRDIAENVKLNHEIAKELRKQSSMSCQCSTLASRWLRKPCLTWIPVSSTGMTRMYVLLSILTLLPTLALAEQCTATPDCKSLGYTETSCPDGSGVKCPWNTSLIYCPQCKQKDPCQSCYVGWILNSDMTCSYEKVSGKTPIGVILQQTVTTVGTAIKCQGIAVALSDLSETTTWSNANYQCSSYSASSITGWHLPTKDELLAVYGNKSAVSSGLTAAGGTQFTSDYYWSSSHNTTTNYWIVNPLSGNTNTSNDIVYTNRYVRPLLAF